MKKIGIITLFGYNNYGNRLQMYAVQQIYKKLGFDSEIIKYQLKPRKEPFIIKIKISIHYLLFFTSNIPISILKSLRIIHFKKHAGIYFTESKDEVNPLIVDDKFHEKYSFFSVGSDQIWGWFTHPIADFVFLKFAPREKRITFSPSFGSSNLEEKYKNVFKVGLEGFNNISVREASGAKIVKQLTNKESIVLCDPTMCLSKNDWLGFATTHKRKPEGKFVLTYFLGEKSSSVCSILAAIPSEFEIIELNSFKSPKFYTVNPSEWVDYINSASLFLTDSFHGVVFSLILQTPFAIYSRVGGESMQTRITNILEKFNMVNRFEITFNDASLFNMDFSTTEEIINIEKSKAYDFLEKSMTIQDLMENPKYPSS